MTNIRRYAKFIAALLTAALAAVTEYALPVPEQAEGWVQLVIALLGVVAVWGIPNATADPDSDPQYDPEAGV